MAIPVDLGRVESTIRQVESVTEWRFALSARTVIHQLFVSLATDEGGFAIPMTEETRHQALSIAHDSLYEFLQRVIDKSKELALWSHYQGSEVGFPVVVHEMDAWTGQMISCQCWPR